MPRKKRLPYRALISQLLRSNKLSPSEHTAFERMLTALDTGEQLTEHQQLWIESLRARPD